jgi:hypothetical protein
MSLSQYKYLKAEWIARNPTVTHAQYQQAMTKLAKKCGI